MITPAPNPDHLSLVRDELDLLAELVPLAEQRILELGCGNARLARSLLERFAGSEVVGLEVDSVQHAKNLAAPQERLLFLAASAEAVPFPRRSFDGAMMLKSLHHVPIPAMDAALAEVARVLRSGGWFYVSEPIYGGALNEIVRLYNDEGVVRAAAQAAVDRALAAGKDWLPVEDRCFAQVVRFAGWADFAQRMLYPSFVELQITPDIEARVKAAFEALCGSDGVRFVRPMHARLLRRRP
ncbi:class I SAM-dependent methyltransferase [Hydrogenophaga sp. RWCD_12]|uniref:class I SAM-dependent methyltransferase n=1 Tax=Hydrogenophaga sp. RWCD_12 TaxID=3391190 RepID=UPI0039852198